MGNSPLSLLLFIAILPVVIILVYINSQDKHKEPASLLIKLFSLGILSCFLVLAISAIVFKIFPFMNKAPEQMNFFEVLLYAFFGVALIEEFSKWLMTYKVGYHNKEFDELYDSIVYAVFVSLGFALFENILYVLGKGSLSVGIFRGLLAIPGHACDAIFMGYHMSLAKLYSKRHRKDLEKKHLILSIVVPTILHGIYDFCLFSNLDFLIAIFFVFVVAMYIIALRKLNDIATTKHKINLTNKFCPMCGNKVEGSFCGRCGTRQE